VRTYVTPFDPLVIVREALLRERIAAARASIVAPAHPI
jgi:hypothetical protein